MEQMLKQRLVGAAVLVALGVIFIPMLLDDAAMDSEPPPGLVDSELDEAEFNSRIVPIDEAQLAAAREAAALPPPLDPPTAVTDLAPEAGAHAAPEAASERTGVPAWVVQLGSFSEQANARKLESRVREAGFPAFVEEVTAESGPVYRVRVGPELRRSSAESVRSQLEKKVKEKGIVMRYPG